MEDPRRYTFKYFKRGSRHSTIQATSVEEATKLMHDFLMKVGGIEVPNSLVEQKQRTRTVPAYMNRDEHSANV